MENLFKSFKLLFIFVLFVHNANAQSLLNVKYKDGKMEHSAFEDIQKLVFSSNNQTLNVHKTNGSVDSYLMNQLRYINFDGEFNTDIQNNQFVNNEKSLNFYPNPCSKVLNIKFSNSLQLATNVEFYSIDGKLLYVHKLDGIGTEFSMDVSFLKQGIYVCRINDGILVQNFKLFKL